MQLPQFQAHAKHPCVLIERPICYIVSTSCQGHTFRITRPFMLVIRRWSVDSQHKGQKCDTLMVSLILVWKRVWPHYATLIIAMAETLYGFWIWSPTWLWCNLCTMISRHGHKCLIVIRCEMWTCFYRNHLLCFNLFDLSMTWRQKDNPN